MNSTYSLIFRNNNTLLESTINLYIMSDIIKISDFNMHVLKNNNIEVTPNDLIIIVKRLINGIPEYVMASIKFTNPRENTVHKSILYARNNVDYRDRLLADVHAAINKESVSTLTL